MDLAWIREGWVRRYCPRWREASQVRRPVVPDAERRERDSRRVIVGVGAGVKGVAEGAEEMFGLGVFWSDERVYVT